jgi:hypothetical protein
MRNENRRLLVRAPLRGRLVRNREIWRRVVPGVVPGLTTLVVGDGLLRTRR